MTTHDCGCVKAIPCARNRSVSAFAPDATARVTVATNAHALAGMSFTPLIRKQIHEKSAFRQSLLVRKLAAEAVFVPIKAVWIGRQRPEALRLDVGAVQVGRGRRDAHGGVGGVAAGARCTAAPQASPCASRRGLGPPVGAELSRSTVAEEVSGHVAALHDCCPRSLPATVA